LGIPRSVFLGQAPADGEFWTPEDRRYALAWQRYKADLCGGCGHPRSESMDIDNEFRYEAEASYCHACAKVAKASAAYAEDPGGLNISTRLKD
jgi:hypothetical protein